ncbi:hypothetical protein [Sphingomonas quercus]|uniref:DUF2188 domain-containing protein n=1 Tax=Sphingomonas quercus TaxID=2842451 RepID=A0ABS6BGY3_9SPHN|nr:hypothetical protein [Sphingomonas quercus]MBU3077563.1 hypothetical protein [Sphingomonas quercus]
MWRVSWDGEGLNCSSGFHTAREALAHAQSLAELGRETAIDSADQRYTVAELARFVRNSKTRS